MFFFFSKESIYVCGQGQLIQFYWNLQEGFANSIRFANNSQQLVLILHVTCSMSGLCTTTTMIICAFQRLTGLCICLMCLRVYGPPGYPTAPSLTWRNPSKCECLPSLRVHAPMGQTFWERKLTLYLTLNTKVCQSYMNNFTRLTYNPYCI